MTGPGAPRESCQVRNGSCPVRPARPGTRYAKGRGPWRLIDASQQCIIERDEDLGHQPEDIRSQSGVSTGFRVVNQFKWAGTNVAQTVSPLSLLLSELPSLLSVTAPRGRACPICCDEALICLNPQGRAGTRRGCPAAAEPRRDADAPRGGGELPDLPLVGSAFDQGSERREEDERGDAGAFGLARPDARLVDERLADIEEDRPHRASAHDASNGASSRPLAPEHAPPPVSRRR